MPVVAVEAKKAIKHFGHSITAISMLDCHFTGSTITSSV